MKKECNCLENGSETCGGDKENIPSIHDELNVIMADFEHDATQNCVPIGVAMFKFSGLLESIDWNIYATKKISLEDARKIIKWAAELMDKKFDIPYQRLPQ